MALQTAPAPEEAAVSIGGAAAPAPVAIPASAGAAPSAPKTFAEIKAARAALPATASPPTSVGPTDATARQSNDSVPVDDKATAQIDMSPEDLAKKTAAARADREARQRTQELETKAGKATKLEAAEALIAQGKHGAALDALGIDLEAAVNERLAVQTEDGKAASPELKAVQDELAKLKETEAARAKREAGDLQARAQAARTSDVAQVVEHVKGAADKYPFLARDPGWVAEAYDKAANTYPLAMQLIEEREGAKRHLTPEEKTRLVEAALAEEEARHAKLAKVYTGDSERGDGAVPPKAGARPTTFQASMRGGTGAMNNPQRPTKLTFDQVKRQRRTAR